MSVNSWETRRLDEVAAIIRGVTYASGQVLSPKSPDALMLLRATNIQDGKLNTNDPVYIPKGLVKPTQMLQQHDIVVASSSGSIQVVGKSASVVQPLDATFGAFCTGIRATGIDPKYLAHYLQDPTLRQKWSDLASGSNINNLKSTHIASTPIPVPPLDEQRRIVETLDDHLSRLDKALAEVKSASLQTSTLRRSVLEEALFGESSLPWTTLGEHVQTRKNKGIPSQEPHAKYLGLENVESHGGRILGFDSASKYRSASPIVEQGDLLYGRLRPYLNKVVLAPERLYVSGEFIVMMPTATLDTKFLKHLLMSPRFLAFTALLDTGDRPRVSWDKIANFEFQIPDLAFQKRIVEQIESSLDVAVSINADIEQLDSQIATLRRALLHSAFAGKMTNG